MKLLFINNGMHIKNRNALLKYNFEIFETNNTNLDLVDLSNFDYVYSPCNPIDVNKYPNTKFLFGPHFSVFPEKHHTDMICGNNSIYIQPSDWARDVWRNNVLCNNIRIETLPFGVDTNKFTEIRPIDQRHNVFIYYKARKPEELNQIIIFLSQFNFNVKIFDYKKKYNEQDYINYLHNSKFGIWIGCHESQGFALQEALSCNVPLMVWNVNSMNQEYGYNYNDIPATSIPYWDSTCGESFKNISELSNIFNKFTNNLMNYKPRKYILENISIDKCSEKFINLVNNI